jgi:cell filamentation protein
MTAASQQALSHAQIYDKGAIADSWGRREVTTGTIRNKLGIADAIELAHAEERISKSAAMSLYRDGTLDALEPGTFATLATIHARLFGEIYDFAGRMRAHNLSKGAFRFASALYLAPAVAAVERVPQSTFDHVFRRELHRTVAWSVIGRKDYLLAMERSPVRDTEKKALLMAALSDDLDDTALLARGIDASHAYEGYATYQASKVHM